MKVDQNPEFWKTLLEFVNKISAQCAQKGKEPKITDDDEKNYFDFMGKEGFDSDETDIIAAFERLKTVDLQREKKRIIAKIKEFDNR